MKKRANPNAIKSLQGLSQARRKRTKAGPVITEDWAAIPGQITIIRYPTEIIGYRMSVGIPWFEVPVPESEEVVTPEETLLSAERHDHIERLYAPLGVDEIRWSEYNRKFNELLKRPRNGE